MIFRMRWISSERRADVNGSLRGRIVTIALLVLGTFPSCDVARIDCLDGDISCNDALLGAIFIPQKIIAYAGSAGVIWVSRDGGLSYQQITPGDPATNYSHIKIVSATRILAGGSNGTGQYIIESRSLEANWQPAFNNTGAALRGLEVTASGDYAGCGANGSTQAEVFYNGPDGNWTITQPAGGTPGSCYLYLGELYATLSSGTFNYKRQIDGSFAPSGSAAPGPTIDGVAINGNLAVLVDNANTRVLRSTDGINWTPHAITGASVCSDAAFGSGIFAVFCVGSDQFMLSTDGINWNPSPTGPSLALSSVQNITYADGFFYVIGQDSGGNAAAVRTVDFGTFFPDFSFPAGNATARDELLVPASLIPSN